MLAYKPANTSVSILYKSLISLLCLTWMLSPGLLASNDTDRPSYGERLVVVPCHEEWDPSPCVCYGIKDKKTPYELRCSNISSVESFRTIFNQVKQPIQLPSFVLGNSSLKMLPAGVFGKVTFKYIVIYNTSIQRLEPGVFQGMEETLTELTFMLNKIKIFDFLRGFQALKIINIEDELYEEIPDHGLANFHRMGSVFIHRCPLHTIGNYAFANTTGNITIWNNTVTVKKIGDYAFYDNVGGNRSVTLMNFTDASFSKNTFVGSFVKMFKLYGVTTLKEDIFSPLLNNSQKGKCYTFKGALKCDESMDWIATNNDTKRAFRFKCKNGMTLEDNIKARQTSS